MVKEAQSQPPPITRAVTVSPTGPFLIVGADTPFGRAMWERLQSMSADVWGLSASHNSAQTPARSRVGDLSDEVFLRGVLNECAPQTVFACGLQSGLGAEANYLHTARLLSAVSSASSVRLVLQPMAEAASETPLSEAAFLASGRGLLRFYDEKGGAECRSVPVPDDPELAAATLHRVAEGCEDAKRWSVSAIIGCYNENPAIPAMYERCKAVFNKLGIDHEIIFINNDNRPGTDAEHLVLELSKNDPAVVGVNMSRNFQSPAGFMSGLQIATKNACVLMDGDLQDPPEFIEQFVEKWKEGYKVVYGRRVKREATPFMQFAFKAFYRVWDTLSYIAVPRDAGDFSLIDRAAVNAILTFPERDLWLRGLRAFVGYAQTGVDYVRPERPWGKSSNNIPMMVHWARKGIFSFSNTLLTVLMYGGVGLLLLSILLIVGEVIWKATHNNSSPWGFATLYITVLFFGALNLFASGVLGEYIGRIFEEVKGRPLYVLRSVTRYGESHPIPPDTTTVPRQYAPDIVPSVLIALEARQAGMAETRKPRGIYRNGK